MSQPNTIKQLIKQVLEVYLNPQKDYQPKNLYSIVLQEIEKPLIETILEHTQGNISQAAKILGISRATLRKKLKAQSTETTF